MSSCFPASLRRLPLVLALLLGGLAGSAAAADAQPPRPVPGEPPQALTPRVLYEFLLGEIAGARGDMTVAVEAYVDLANRTRDVRIVRRAAEMALVARNFPVARQMARLWVELTPDSADARRVLAGLEQNGGDLSAAQGHFARALAEAGQQLPELLLNLPRLLGRYGDPVAVQAAVQRLTEPYLGYPEAQFARAQADQGIGDEAAAMQALEAALQQRADWEPAVLFKAQLLQRKSPEAARDWLAAYLARHPDDPTARNAYARSLVGTRQFAEAREQFRKLLEVRPEDNSVRYAEAVLALQQKDLDDAESQFLKLLEVGQPDPDTLRMHLAQVALERDNYAGARQWLEAVETPALRVDARIQVAQILARHGDIDEARAYLQAQEGDAATVRRYRMAEAQLLRDAGRYQDAYDFLDGLSQDYPDDPDILYESAMLAERLGHFEVMEGRLRKLIALQPEYAQAYNALGYLLADRNERLDEADKLLTRALALSPDDPYILDSVGWLAFRRGQLDRSLDYLGQAYRRQADPEIAAHLGEVQWTAGRQDEARKTWEAARAAHPDNAVLRATMQRFLP